MAKTVTITQDEADLILEYANANMQCDLDSYTDADPVWACSKSECKKLWLSIIKKCKSIATDQE